MKRTVDFIFRNPPIELSLDYLLNEIFLFFHPYDSGMRIE